MPSSDGEDSGMAAIRQDIQDLQEEIGDLLSRHVGDKKVLVETLLKLCVEMKKLSGLDAVVKMLTKRLAESPTEWKKLSLVCKSRRTPQLQIRQLNNLLRSKHGKPSQQRLVMVRHYKDMMPG